MRPGLDLIIVAKPGADKAKFMILKNDFLFVAKKSGFLEP